MRARHKEETVLLPGSVKAAVERSRRESMTVRIEADGLVRLLVPFWLPLEDVERFALEHMDWISRNRENVLRQRAQREGRLSLAGGQLPVLGRPVAYRVQPASGKRDRVVREGNALVVQLSVMDEVHLQAALIRHLKGVALEVIRDRIARYQPYFSSRPVSVSIGSARTRWGSCTGDNRLRFCWRIVMAPMPVLDYLVVHEMSHMEYHDHSPAFWEKVESILPDYRERRGYLMENGGAYGLDIA